MINETDDMRQARHELQMLSASDPLARANMLRHVAACTQLLTGRPGVEALPGEPLVGAGFRLMNGEANLFATFTRRDGVERIYIAFDIDDAQGMPIGIGLFRKEGSDVMCHGLCKLWSPVGSGRALLVPTGEGAPPDTSRSGAGSRSGGSEGACPATSSRGCAAPRRGSRASSRRPRRTPPCAAASPR